MWITDSWKPLKPETWTPSRSVPAALPFCSGFSQKRLSDAGDSGIFGLSSDLWESRRRSCGLGRRGVTECQTGLLAHTFGLLWIQSSYKQPPGQFSGEAEVLPAAAPLVCRPEASPSLLL